MDRGLALIDNDLAADVANLPPRVQRRIAFTAARFALEWNSLDDPVCTRALETPQDVQEVDQNLLSELLTRVEALDEVQWALHDALDEGCASREDYVAAFRRARAVNAVYCALDSDPHVAASECLYEANAATQQIDVLRRIVMQTLEEFKHG